MTTLPRTDVLRRRVGLNYLEWLAEPGEYIVAESLSKADRARLARLTRKAGNTFRSSRTVDGVLVTIWKGVLR